MTESHWQRTYRQDAQVLGEMGQVLAQTDLPGIVVRVPRRLAEQALAAWEREGDEGKEGPPGPETFEQRAQRRRAGTLGLIGLSIEQDGRWDGDQVIVELSPDLIGMALDAADFLPSD